MIRKLFRLVVRNDGCSQEEQALFCRGSDEDTANVAGRSCSNNDSYLSHPITQSNSQSGTFLRGRYAPQSGLEFPVSIPWKRGDKTSILEFVCVPKVKRGAHRTECHSAHHITTHGALHNAILGLYQANNQQVMIRSCLMYYDRVSGGWVSLWRVFLCPFLVEQKS
jgi:hypothetical protein